MNLAIDIGNTKIKLASFKEGELVNRWISSEQELLSIIDQFEFIMASSTRNLSHPTIQKLRAIPKVKWLDSKLKMPFNNFYQTPETLGKDRLANVAGSTVVYPDKEVVIIDLGTCITYDYITAENDFMGGVISPGFRMRLKAMHNFTGNLPLVSPELGDKKGLNTHSAIFKGAFEGIVHEINGFANEFLKNPNSPIILTGGDASYFENDLKKPTFAHPELTLLGINKILELNVLEN